MEKSGGSTVTRGGEPASDRWKESMTTECRKRVADSIMETAKRVHAHENPEEYQNFATLLEDKVFAASSSEKNYIMRITLNMLKIEAYKEAEATSLPSQTCGIRNRASDPGIEPETYHQSPVPNQLAINGSQVQRPQLPEKSRKRNSAKAQCNADLPSEPATYNSTQNCFPCSLDPSCNMHNMSVLTENLLVGPTRKDIGTSKVVNPRREGQRPDQQLLQGQNSQLPLYHQRLQEQALHISHSQPSQQPGLQSYPIRQQSIIPLASSPSSHLQPSNFSYAQQSSCSALWENQQSAPTQICQAQDSSLFYPRLQQQSVKETMQWASVSSTPRNQFQCEQRTLMNPQFVSKKGGLMSMQQQQQGDLPTLMKQQEQQQLVAQGDAFGLHWQQQPQLPRTPHGTSSTQTNFIGPSNCIHDAFGLQLQQQPQQPFLGTPYGISSIHTSLIEPPNCIQPGVQQNFQESGSLVGEKHEANQQMQSFPSQSLLPGASTSLDSGPQMDQANMEDWRERVYRKIDDMKKMYLPELEELDKKLGSALQQQQLHLQIAKSEQFGRLQVVKRRLGLLISFLRVPKSAISPAMEEKLGSLEKYISGFIEVSRTARSALVQQQQQQHSVLPCAQPTLPQQSYHFADQFFSTEMM